jgi:2-keto-4-pentenoate hydratase/2-oxohepta-3-ene-1,7-dioic acid hydratase in catechol pathway
MTKAAENPQIGQRSDLVRYCAPYYDPPKILGIGLNYREHAVDLGAQQPSAPASFMKPRTTIIGHGDSIVLPTESKRVTAEAELGLIIGKRCKHVREDDVESVIFGYVPILDMTAEDILQENPRFLTRAKSFDTFLSFGPVIFTQTEISNLPEVTVGTVLNGQVVKSNQIRNMMFSPRKLVSFFSNVMTFEPGDIISTGTPGAVVIKNGDVVECRIDGFSVLSNHVVERS